MTQAELAMKNANEVIDTDTRKWPRECRGGGRVEDENGVTGIVTHVPEAKAKHQTIVHSVFSVS